MQVRALDRQDHREDAQGQAQFHLAASLFKLRRSGSLSLRTARQGRQHDLFDSRLPAFQSRKSARSSLSNAAGTPTRKITYADGHGKRPQSSGVWASVASTIPMILTISCPAPIIWTTACLEIQHEVCTVHGHQDDGHRLRRRC